jgi:hypothetical protein
MTPGLHQSLASEAFLAILSTEAGKQLSMKEQVHAIPA